MSINIGILKINNANLCRPFHPGAIEHQHHFYETKCCEVFEIVHKQLDLEVYYMNVFCLTYQYQDS